jgi:hypothetical protein
MWQELHWGKRQTMGLETQGTQVNLEVSHLERSRLAQHSVEENHHVLSEEVKILENEKNPVYMKHQEAAYMACLQNPISPTKSY